MLDILAETSNQVVTGMIAGSGVLAAAALTIKHVTNEKKHPDAKDLVNREVCDERHKNLNATLIRIEEKIDELGDFSMKKD